ncbi:hypothetical protein FAGAP_10425 [Fusarium agapanthi]|uniref:Uncharacterized protein n=1 Tax=Fusarium agapanthi TaxID=1803897 RepID=A0A9P5B188_9HYPO|nr:hypothetical protein FAGAP_10425 [Fusarium agapanthi]
MAAPRRSKRIQTLHQTEEGSRRITESSEALNKDHPDGDAPRDLAPKEETPVIDPAVRRAELGKQWEKKRDEEVKERSRKITESKDYLDRMLALERHACEAVRHWNELSGTIESLVHQMDLRGITWDNFDEAVQQKFISFAPNVEELFDVYGMPPCVFQRWVWEIIDENFFSNKGKDIIWTSPYWETQAAMERYLQEHNFPYDNGIASYKYPHWRHATMEFYMALEDSPKKPRRIDPTCVVPILSKALGRYFPKKRDGTLPVVLKHLEDELVATEFLFDSNLTFFSIVFQHPTTHQTCGFPYEPELDGIEGQAMDEIEDDSGEEKLVDFVAEPMLQCRGHDDGYDYHVKTAESPMKVCVDWLQNPKRPRLSEMTRGVREEENEERDKETNEETDEERDKDEKYQEDQEDEEADSSKRVDKEEKEEEEESIREITKDKGKEVKVLTKEEESREKVDKEEDNKDEDNKDEDNKDEDNKGITKDGGKNNKNKEREDKEKDKPEEEGDLTKHEEKKININNTTKSRKKKKNKGKRR